MVKGREDLARLNEEELRTQVIIPLFKAMGFRDVDHYHGREGELGKDIVMWKPGIIRERENYGVVAKRGKITGKAAGQSSANAVRVQVEQLFANPYSDPITTRKQRIDHCFVVVSGTISKEARESIRGILEVHNLDKNTDFISGEKLWELVEQYMPQWTALEKVLQAQKILEEASPHWRVTVNTQGGQTTLSVEPKHPRAEEEQPLEGAFRLRFPQTSEGQEAVNALDRWRKTGEAVTIDGQYIAEFKQPPLFDQLFSSLPNGPQALTIGPRVSPLPRLVSMEVETPEGEHVGFEYIHLNAVQVGDEEITFRNSHQPIPWRFRLVLKKEGARATFNYKLEKLNPAGINVRWVLKGLRFQQAIAKGGTLRIQNLDTGFDLVHTQLSARQFEPPDPRFMSLVENVMFIQNQVRVPISIPNRYLTVDEAVKIMDTEQKLRTGRVRSMGDVTVETDKTGAVAIIEAFKSDGSLRVGPIEHFENVFGVPIPMGPAILTCRQARIPEEDLEPLNATVAAAEATQSIGIRLRPSGPHPMVMLYPKWASDADEETGIDDPKRSQSKPHSPHRNPKPTH